MRSMEDTMKQLYNEIILLHEVVALLVEIRKKYQETVKLLKVENRDVDLIQECGVKYSYFPKWLVKREKKCC